MSALQEKFSDLGASAVGNIRAGNLWNVDVAFTMGNMAGNRTTEYAVRALVVLALEGSRGRVRHAAALAKISGTPPKFLEQVLRILGKGGLVRSRRGAGGGYELARPASEIRMSEIVGLMEREGGDLPRGGDPVGEEWGRLRKKAKEANSEIFHMDTLEKFVERVKGRILATGKASEYQI